MNYYWDFGNGTTSTLVSPSVTFAPGTYTVTLIATGNFGCSDTVTQVIKVGADNKYCALSNASFTVNAATQCLATNSVVFTSNNTFWLQASSHVNWSTGREPYDPFTCELSSEQFKRDLYFDGKLEYDLTSYN